MKLRIFIFQIFVTIIFAQYDWQDNGVPVRQGIHIEWQRTGDVGNEEEMIFAWSDTRYGGRDIYAKKIDKNGNDLWDGDGTPIVIAPGRQEDPILVSDDNGGAYVIWVDYRDEPEYGDIYAQHINSSGDLSWDIQGVPLTVVPGKQVSPNMSKDGLGGAFVIWNDLSVSTLGHVYGTHITNNSEDIIAPGTGVPLISSDYSHTGVSIEVAQAGSAIMVWTDNRNLDNTDLDIYGQRIDVDCNTLWSAPEEGGIPMCSFDSVQQYTKVTYYNEEVSVVVWEDRRNNPSAGDVYAQFVNMDGEISNIDGIEICTDESIQIKPRVKASPLGAHIIWEDKRNGHSDIYAQLLTYENGVEWDVDGIGVCNATGAQDQPRLTTDSYGGAYYVWMDERYNSFPETEIFAQYLDLNGNPSFENDGVSISSAPQYQFSPLVRSDGQNGALVLWGDMRSGSIGLYAQHISTISNSITFQEDGVEYYFGIDGNGIKAKSKYIGNDETLLYWEDHRLGVFADLTYGQKVFSGWEEIQEPNGLKLSENIYQTDPQVETLNDGEKLFMGFGQADGDIVLHYQLLDNDINILGDDNGTTIDNTPPFTPQSSFDLVRSNSGLVVAYSDMSNYIDSDIFLQRFGDDGVAEYFEPILIVENFLVDDNVNFVTELAGGVIVVGFDSGSFVGTRSVIVGVDYEGNVLEEWVDENDVSGKRICMDENDQFIQGHAVSPDGVLIIWKDQREGNADIYAQMVDSNGDLLLGENGLAVASGGNDQQAPTITYNENENEFMVCWEDFSGVDFDILCRTINSSSLELGEEIVLCDDPSNQKAPNVFSTLDGSYLFAWEDSRGSLTSDIYFQHMKNGQNQFAENGIVLCDADFNQKDPQINIYNESNNSYLVYWDDLRSSGKEDLTNIYAQSYTVSNDDSCVLGDVNQDQILNVLDIVNLVNFVLGLAEFDDSQLCAADLNQDEVINVIDVVSLVNIVLSI